jgi:16S rRNA (cytidine1402-2'-O)-methyltransferase
VATPIGNLEDLTPRAVRVLKEADLIAAEDTRHSGRLTAHFGIATRMLAVHDHNEREQVPRLIESLKAGKSIAFISDAGTPLVSDPGFPLVRAARAEGLPVVPIPGPCAAIVALSVAGLPSDRFVFEGFPPPKLSPRRARFAELREDPRTLIFYESPHRVQECLADMVAIFGAEREAVVARELTKQFETVRGGSLGAIEAWLQADSEQLRGEFVILLHGAERTEQQVAQAEAERVLRILLAELPVSQAAALAAQIAGAKKNELYELALRLKT